MEHAFNLKSLLKITLQLHYACGLDPRMAIVILNTFQRLGNMAY